MSQSTETWTYDEDAGRVTDSHGITVALYVTKHNGQRIAAAPDMQEALEEVARSQSDEVTMHLMLNEVGHDMVGAAIAKAKGESE